MLCSERVGFAQGLSGQREGDRIVVRRVDPAVYVARTRPQWPANERPINPAAPFKQAARGSGKGAARGGHSIVKPSVRSSAETSGAARNVIVSRSGSGAG